MRRNVGRFSHQPLLKEFLEKEFLAYARTKHSNKPNTLDYYEFGAARLIAAEIGKLRLDAVTDKEAQIFAAEYIGTLKVSTINCYLRTLRRALRLAVDWKQLDRSPKITLLVGERQREYVVPDEDWTLYIASCRQPWRDAAILIRFTGIRPDECFSLRWENAQFVEQSGLIQITTGKSRAARRTIPMLPVVWEAVHQRWEAQGNPSHGWVFPSTASCGHLTQDSAKNQHKKAIKDSKVKHFEPYCLRHTALTQFSSYMDAFALKTVAGHSSITLTQRYCHPQADTIERGFKAIVAENQTRASSGRGRKKNSKTTEAGEKVVLGEVGQVFWDQEDNGAP